MTDNEETRAVNHSDRRERIATAILAAFITNNHVWQNIRPGTEARIAVDFADALIAELDKEPSR